MSNFKYNSDKIKNSANYLISTSNKFPKEMISLENAIKKDLGIRDLRNLEPDYYELIVEILRENPNIDKEHFQEALNEKKNQLDYYELLMREESKKKTDHERENEKVEARLKLYKSLLESPREKTIGKPKIKKTSTKKSIDKKHVTKAIKKILSVALATIVFASITAGLTYKVHTKIEERQAITMIEERKIDELTEYLKNLGITIDNLAENINNDNIEIMSDDDLYSYYLTFTEKMDLSYKDYMPLMDRLVQKIGFDNFGLYTKNKGYIDLSQPNAPHGSFSVWLNYMEGNVINEVKRSKM